MKNLLLLEWQKVKWPVILVLMSCTALSVYLCSTIYKTYALEQQLEAWEVGMPIFNVLFALIAVIPTGWVMYYERKNGFINYTLPRTSKRQYLLAKWLIMSGSAFAIMFVLSFAGVLVVLLTNNPIEVIYSFINPETGNVGPRVEENHFLGSMFTHQPLLYGFLLSVWKGILTALMATMGFVFSLYTSNLFIILTGPFVYTIIENFILAILRLEAYRLVVSFEPTSITPKALNIFSFITGPILVVLLLGGYFCFMHFIKKSSIYSV